MLSNVVWNTIYLKLTFLKSLFCQNVTSTLPLCLVLFAKLLGPHCQITSPTSLVLHCQLTKSTSSCGLPECLETVHNSNFTIYRMAEVHSFAVQTVCPRKENRSISGCLMKGISFFLGEMGVFIRRCENWVNLDDNCKHT